MTEQELQAIEARLSAGGPLGQALAVAEQDVPALVAEVRRLRENEWQPILTAKEYLTVLVFDARIAGVTEGYLRDGEWHRPSDRMILYPTHWMPKPEPPTVMKP